MSLPPAVPADATLADRIARDLAAEVDPLVRDAAERLARDAGAVAVLFYGSVLRTRQLGDVLDFYLLLPRASGPLWRRVLGSTLWPDVSWREVTVGGIVIRAKVAAMPLAIFERAAAGGSIDTTIWARFAQPSALVWAATAEHRERVVRAVAAAVVTTAGFAALLGPRRGSAIDYWQALFGETYRTELRVERAGRSGEIVGHAPDRYAALLPLAWREAGIAFDERDGTLRPHLRADESRRLAAQWFARVAAGKPLNLARLVKAAFTFDGATRYALYKIERHTGIRVPMTPWRERHPVLAAPGVLWRVLRAPTA